MKKVGILGSGDVAQKLGAGFVASGYEVRLGSREPRSEKLAAWKLANGSAASTGSFEETAQFGDLLALATLWTGTENALRLAGLGHFAGKVVIDVTNPLVFHPNGLPSLAVGNTDSGGEQVQRWLPHSHVVKAFNSVGNAHMFRPDFPGGPPDMFYCGNDEAAKDSVKAILETFGWNPVDLGGIELARVLEPLCILWVAFMFHSGTPNHSLKMLHR
ncbi:MAG: NAD(P)-binding domain-containing protein [Thermoplasmata archaeon]|nr:NAD(P)-binding domain-containing protein [Thermoplasmata archaeon]